MSTSRPLPPAPSPLGRPRPRTVVVLAVALATVVVAAGAMVVLHVTTGSAGSATPEDAVSDYLTAEESYDCSVLVQHPIAGYEDRQDCEEGVADLREDYEDDGIDPDSRTHTINFVVDVSQESDDLASVTIDVTFSQEREGRRETAGGGFRGYDVARSDNGGWVVLEWVYED